MTAYFLLLQNRKFPLGENRRPGLKIPQIADFKNRRRQDFCHPQVSHPFSDSRKYLSTRSCGVRAPRIFSSMASSFHQ